MNMAVKQLNVGDVEIEELVINAGSGTYDLVPHLEENELRSIGFEYWPEDIRNLVKRPSNAPKEKGLGRPPPANEPLLLVSELKGIPSTTNKGWLEPVIEE